MVSYWRRHTFSRTLKLWGELRTPTTSFTTEGGGKLADYIYRGTFYQNVVLFAKTVTLNQSKNVFGFSDSSVFVFVIVTGAVKLI